MWPDPSGFPYRREAAILSYNVNVYRPRATAPSWTRLSHTLLFPAESTKNGGFPGSWKMVLTYKCREGFHKSTHSVFIGVLCYTDPSWERSVTLPSDLIYSPWLPFFINILGRTTTSRSSLQEPWQVNSKHTVTMKTTTQKYSSRELQKDHRRFFNQPLRNRSVTMKTAPTTMDTNIAANVQDLFSGEIYLNRLSECNFGFDLYK